jgi:hypothetical protein
MSAEEDKPDWASIEADVLFRIRLLRASWDHTAGTAIHASMKRDLYIPVLKLLSEFCVCVETEGKQ